MTATIIDIKEGLAEIRRNEHVAKLVIEMGEIHKMLVTINTDDFLRVKTYCEKEEYTERIYDKVLTDRYDVLQRKLLKLKNSKGE